MLLSDRLTFLGKSRLKSFFGYASIKQRWLNEYNYRGFRWFYLEEWRLLCSCCQSIHEGYIFNWNCCLPRRHSGLRVRAFFWRTKWNGNQFLPKHYFLRYLEFRELIVIISSLLCHFVPLIFIFFFHAGKYREFHKMYEEGKFHEAANLLISLLTSKLAPQRWIKYWLFLVLTSSVLST